MESDVALAATDRDLGVEGGSLGVDKPLVCGAGGKRLDIVVEDNVGENELQLLRGKETTWAVVWY